MNVGNVLEIDGDVTNLRGSGLFGTEAAEAMLGYGTGRLAKGYYVLLLKQRITEADFKFAGLTLRSGGRRGLPGKDIASDTSRMHVHDQMMTEYGADHYRKLQTKALSELSLSGEDRLVKVLPVIRHIDGLPPNVQYPAGGGALQWTLVKRVKFLVALFVDEVGQAHWTGGSAKIGLGPSGPIEITEARRQVRLYLRQA